MSYHRAASPGSRRLANPARQSASDGYYGTSAYASPRSSAERIVPIPAFVPRVDPYSGRPRRSTLTAEPSRPITTTTTTTVTPTTSSSNIQVPSSRSSRPAVVQSSHDTTHSASSPHGRSSRPSENYYAVPNTSTSSSHRDRENPHRKLYSVDNGGKSRLVADIDINTAPSSGTSHRKHSLDRNGNRLSGSHHHHKAYHLTGSNSSSTRHANPEPDKNYSYTDPAGMYDSTEPRWRHRQGSVEGTRSRPSSTLIDPYGPRSSARELGPPTARALDRFNDGIGRGPSVRDAPARSSNRLSYQDQLYTPDLYVAPPPSRHATAVHQDRVPYDPYLRDAERARPKQRYEDSNIQGRGFGIRSGSQDRYAHDMSRGSNESFDSYYSDRDRDHVAAAAAAPPPPRGDPRGYDYPSEPERPREYRPRDRERDRPRDDGYASERERERHYDRSDKRDRDRDRDRDRRDRDRDATPRGSGDSLTNTLLPAGIGAVAAAAYGAKETGRDRDRDREYDDRDRVDRGDRDRDQDRYREKEQKERERVKEKEQQREREREQQDREKEREREYEREKREREKERDREYERERAKDQEREQRTRERPQQPDVDAIRSHHSPSSDSGREGHRRSRRHHTAGEDTSPPSDKDRKYDSDERRRRAEKERAPPVDPLPQIDPDEDYRRRVEQAQRDLAGNGSQENSGSEKPARGGSFDSVLNHSVIPNSATIIDNRESTSKETRVRIVEPPSDRDEPKHVRGILKRPTSKFPEDPHPIREGVAPLKEVTEDGIPPGARWTRIDRRLVNPQALEHAQERFEERLDCVIVLRVLTKEEIQKLADKTSEIRDARHYSEHEQAEAERHERRERRRRDRRERDEYSDGDSEDEYKVREPRMLEAPEGQQEGGGGGGTGTADFVRDRERRRGDRDREREREVVYAER